MGEDFARRYPDRPDRAEAACLDAIQDLLRARGKSLADFGLPTPRFDLIDGEQADPLDWVDRAVEAADLLERLTIEQRTVYDRVMAAVDDGRPVSKLFYVDGPGGTGKTTLYSALISTLRGQGRTVLPVAFTGIAASLMDGGMTVSISVLCV